MIWFDIIAGIAAYLIFIYSICLLGFYVFIGLFSITETINHLRRNNSNDYKILAASPHAPSVSIIAPAFNEGATIVDNVRSLLSIYYSNLQIIIVNDGSTDNSLHKLIKAYSLQKVDQFIPPNIPCRKIKAVYKSGVAVFEKLLVIDKENGGKADSLNAGINLSSCEYIVSIDVDCILEEDALLKIVKPLIEESKAKVIASGGVVRIANSSIVEDGKLVKVRLSKNYLARVQTLEYMRAFLLGRMAWSRLNGLLLISGAFGAFDKELVIKCGGYNTNTVGEDMELVVRMRRYMQENNKPYEVKYIPDPLCWTEVPSTFKVLGRQRNRWMRGTLETLKAHRVMLFNKRYGLMGLLSYPYWLLFETMGPVIEFFGILIFVIAVALGLVAWNFFLAVVGFMIAFACLYSTFAVLMEVMTYHQYRRWKDVALLLITALTEPFVFHPFVVWSSVRGLVDYMRKKKSWGVMTRSGFGTGNNIQPDLLYGFDKRKQ